ncbi:MAG: hypothetical protein U5N21_02275 [Rhodococcus sp. (in: high G+C Gram-positive bacteria)]|uniref:hypothetical protein n=1 Tax=Rhodococcus sp. TaxID=1831 RepID=UPI002AD812A0|nr:hypothetical protein [Rhodococcus sp. (in: high G+C Gram-positive bacteria)]MDZ7928951.1 hypothetical protein [Rhodococcus sp. (in: high G+C Gram-positive bacteria)]
MIAKDARSIVMIVAGGVLALFFWDLRVFWFQGGPIGCVLVVLAMVDVWESRRGTPRKGLLAELRDDIVGRKDSGDTSERDTRP